MNNKAISAMEARKAEEKGFHDKLRHDSFGQRWSPELEGIIQDNPLWVNMKYYAIEKSKIDVILNWFKINCPGKTVLDYCCGNGEDAYYIAVNGAKKVIGIDISDVSIQNCRRKANDLGLKNISFEVMDGENLDFPDKSIDIVTEYGALHHLNLEKAYSEIARVLKPDGKAICVEALGHNKVIHLYRKLTPKLRTEWEVDHILRKKDIEMAKNLFKDVKVIGFFHLASIAAVPFRNMSFFDNMLKALESIDSALLKIPVIKWWAWCIVFELSNPL